jgi:pantoate--beta-alanine ligase
MPQIIQNEALLRVALDTYRREGKQIGFVPTMGALHEGHLNLVRAAREKCDVVVVSVFVNPMQFGAHEDLDRYPKRIEKDSQLLQQEKVDLLYVPTVDAMYPEGFSTIVTVEGLSDGLCGAVRPRHFAGVATVVTKLFMQVLPEMAFFGEKDYQQLQVIRRMVTDLSIPVHVLGVPTTRDTDGLALSSRNQYLSAEERKTAPALYKTLITCANKISGGMNITETLEWAEHQLLNYGFQKLDYIECCDAHTLEPLSRLRPPARILAAAWLGETRLIDNIAVPA